MKILSRNEVVKTEQAAMAEGLGQLRLMENAGAAAARVIRQNWAVAGKKVVVVAGPGNNGGDGYVIARKLRESEAQVIVVQATSAHPTGAVAEMYDRVCGLRIPVLLHTDPTADAHIASADIIVDAIFGTGYTLREDAATDALIRRINISAARRVAVDLPSGAECDTGKVAAQCVNADLTVTFIAYKPCHFLPPACNLCGQVEPVSIGIQEHILAAARPAMETLEKAEMWALLPRRRVDCHKFDCGKAAVVGGSYGMAGAVAIALKGAVRSGVGVGYGIVPERIYPIVATLVPEAVFTPMPENGLGTLSAAGCEKMLATANDCDAILLGPGLGRGSDCDKILRYFIKNAKKPLVIDADGLNALSGCIDITKQAEIEKVITPHAGEAARLLGISAREVQADRFACAKKLAELTGAIAVLKGQNTLIAVPDGQVFVCTRGTPGLATAGSGDLLAGILCCLLAQGLPAQKAACLAVYLHATAGELAAAKYSERYITPREMTEALSGLFCEIEANG